MHKNNGYEKMLCEIKKVILKCKCLMLRVFIVVTKLQSALRERNIVVLRFDKEN